MPAESVPRVLYYVGLLLLLTTASTFCWWIAAQAARVEYRSLTSAFACAMRWFFYSVCLLCILVLALSLNFGPDDPRSRLLGWIHLGGTVWVSAPCAWRAFRTKGARLVLAVAIGWALCAAALAAAAALSPTFRRIVVEMPAVLVKST